MACRKFHQEWLAYQSLTLELAGLGGVEQPQVAANGLDLCPFLLAFCDDRAPGQLDETASRALVHRRDKSAQLCVSTD
jgi:hypothetical protein